MNDVSTQPTSLESQIPEHLKDKVYQLKKQLVTNDLTSISTFGADVSTKAANFSNTINSVIKIGEVDEISGKMNQMLTLTKSFEPQKILNKKAGFLSSLFGKVVNPIEEFKNQRLTITEGINKVAQGLEANKTNMFDGIGRLEQQYIENQENIEYFTIAIGAGVFKAKEVQEELVNLQEKVKKDNTNQNLVNEYRNLQYYSNQLDIRIHNLISARSLALLQSEQIKNAQNTKVQTIENINTMITIAIPAFAQQTAIYAEQLETKKANEMNQAVKSIVNETITENAKLMYENSIASVQMANSSVIEASTIETAQNYLIKTIEDTLKITTDAKAKRDETNKLILAKEQELRLSLTNQTVK